MEFEERIKIDLEQPFLVLDHPKMNRGITVEISREVHMDNSIGLKVQGCVEEVGPRKSSLTPSWLFIVSL